MINYISTDLKLQYTNSMAMHTDTHSRWLKSLI